MQPNPQRPAPRPAAQRPKVARPGGPRPPAARPQGARPATPNIPRNDLPPGMGGGEPAGRPGGVSSQPMYSGGNYSSPPPQVGSMNTKAWGGMGLGALLTVGGIVATMASYSSAGPGERFTVWWGPVLFGVITFFGGVAALFKK